MSKAFDLAQTLRWLSLRLASPQWSQGGLVLEGALGERLVRAMRFDDGPTLALRLEASEGDARRICLLLAATEEALDDAVYLAGGRLWLLRRYPPCLTETELELLIKQQQALAQLLERKPENQAAPRSLPGSYA
ncbi:hypothetical protein JQK19_20800 [Chromobacterium violaceum]|uniref:hypothetical protein n=1 Tax=Chromobacterium violaceum TaxID=536 RepID=UPI001BEA3690|nr:hypothetical protein [Chromobacterium violaceum]MBT2869673.1 hypothetical protein [Chromobacterium violaceum]